MAQHKLLDIANKLIELSRLAKVNWQASEEDNAYFVTYSHSSFSVWSDEVDPRFYRISAMNANGVVVDSLDFQGDYNNGYTLVGELYDLAKRQSLGIDEVLDSLLQEIDQQST